jgi:hypothetical protein
MAEAKPKETTESDDDLVAVQWATHPGDRATIRRITKADWKNVGVEDQDTVEWDTSNPLTEGQAWISSRAALYLEKAEQGFRKVPEGKLAFNLQK